MGDAMTVRNPVGGHRQWLCSCGATGRLQQQDEAEAIAGWRKHVSRAPQHRPGTR